MVSESTNLTQAQKSVTFDCLSLVFVSGFYTSLFLNIVASVFPVFFYLSFGMVKKRSHVLKLIYEKDFPYLAKNLLSPMY